ncbi:MAG: hypothetical protein IID17_14000 [Nitrospinae bacterium]|nr:hypothetical protein [Nitrospinota bacterium]
MMQNSVLGFADQFLYFNAGQVGLASFTVYRSRNGAAAAAFNSPTINETDATNMPGVYELLLDEDMTIGGGNLTEAMSFWITHAAMSPVFAEIELFALNNLAASDVLTQINAALDTAITELGVATPAASPTLRTGLMLLYMALRDKMDTTPTDNEIHNDAGAVIATASVNDDGVVLTRGKYT